jgi:hypothetical protein
MLSGINHKNTNLSTNERSNIAPSFSDDLGTNVSQQLRDKIINGEYLELEFLLSIHTMLHIICSPSQITELLIITYY